MVTVIAGVVWCSCSVLLTDGGERGLLTPVVKAMELYELPNEMPMATRWAGSAGALMAAGGSVCLRRAATTRD